MIARRQGQELWCCRNSKQCTWLPQALLSPATCLASSGLLSHMPSGLAPAGTKLKGVKRFSKHQQHLERLIHTPTALSSWNQQWHDQWQINGRYTLSRGSCSHSSTEKCKEDAVIVLSKSCFHPSGLTLVQLGGKYVSYPNTWGSGILAQGRSEASFSKLHWKPEQQMCTSAAHLFSLLQCQCSGQLTRHLVLLWQDSRVEITTTLRTTSVSNQFFGKKQKYATLLSALLVFVTLFFKMLYTTSASWLAQAGWVRVDQYLVQF